MFIPPSELILNPDGSIYHLKLKPGEIADTVITVGDPERVDMVARHLDSIELNKKSREFRTVTGRKGDTRLSIISTGIGTDNIDIVLNELDALVNVDFTTRKVNAHHNKLTICRIGTSGAIRDDVPIDAILVSKYALGMDGLLRFYEADDCRLPSLEEIAPVDAYGVSAHKGLHEVLSSSDTLSGITVTAAGFYGPQTRHVRLKPKVDIVSSFKDKVYDNTHFTNLEMETAGIYGLSALLGHEAISINAILANRVTHEFSSQPQRTIEQLIAYTLSKLLS